MLNKIKKYFNDLRKGKSLENDTLSKNTTNEPNLKQDKPSLNQILKNKSADDVEDLMTYAYSNKYNSQTYY